MRQFTLVLAVLAVLGALAGPALAETYRFDMGGPDTRLAPGFTLVTPQTQVATNPAYGWTKRVSALVPRNDPDNPFYATQDTAPEFALYSDAHLSMEENTFIFQVQPGRYAVTAVMGDLALGEGRPGQCLWANGEQVVKDEGTDASVKACTFPVNAADGKIELRFRVEVAQKYVTVEAVWAEPVAADQEVPVTVKQLPAQRPTREEYLRHWGLFQEKVIADWAEAKRQLTAEGVDLKYWQQQLAALRKRPDYREYWGWSIGSGAWERMANLMGDLPLGPLVGMYREMGIDGFGCNSGVVAKQLTAGGLKHNVAGSAERYPAPENEPLPMNLMRKADGATGTLPLVWSNCAPEAIEAFRSVWRRGLAAAAPGASYFVIDEPRGMWFSGQFGDHSPPAQELFKRWAAAEGYPDLAAKGIPEPGRTWDFYRFYQFRLTSVPLFTRATAQGTPVEGLTIMPGNGDCGPEQMNHSNLWPPAWAKAGMVCATWSYGEPAAIKMHAETLRIAQEHGGKSVMVPPMYPEEQTPLQDLPRNTTGISALNTFTMPWHFRGPSSGPDRPAWMKLAFLNSRLTHATSGLQHTPPLYVWCPESIVFNDLVDFAPNESQAWKKVYQALDEVNLDYAVTNTLAVPKGSVVLYACVKPVLNREEVARLQKFLAAGGTLLCAFAGQPQWPDGTPVAEWAKLPAARLAPVELSGKALAAQVQARKLTRNWAVTQPGLRTYRYVRNGKPVHLLNNTNLTDAAAVKLPKPMLDLLNGRKLAGGSTLRLPPGGHALLGE